MLASALDARIDEVLARLRIMLGKAWREPARVQMDIRAKRRAGNLETDCSVVVTLQFDTGTRFVVAEHFGTDEWRIRTEA